jgi:hypothetical protein
MLKLVIAATGALALGGCVSPPPPFYLTAPTDPSQAAPSMRDARVTAGTRSFRPVEPKGWEQLNDDVAPKRGAGQEGHHGR